MNSEPLMDFNKPEMLKFFLEKTEDVLIILNQEMEVIFLSDAVEKILEFPIGEFLGKNYKEVFIDFPSISVLKTNYKTVIPITTKINQKRLMMEFDFQHISLPNLPEKFYLCVGRDVTERETVLKKFEAISQKEQELSQLKTRFVSMASHEFKTPIATILSSVMIMQMLLEKEFSEEIRKKMLTHTERIINQSNRLTSILSDVLLLEKSMQQDLKLNLSSIQVGQFLKLLVEEINEENMHKREVILFHPTIDKWLTTDESLLTPIIRNLIQNALNYSQNSKDPEVHLIISDQSVEILVKDYGIGIPEEDQEHIFGSFFRAKNVGNVKGTGLGLNIIQSLTKKLNGKIWFKSKEGVGSEFFISFPI